MLYKMLLYMIDCEPREVAVSGRALKQAHIPQGKAEPRDSPVAKRSGCPRPKAEPRKRSQEAAFARCIHRPQCAGGAINIPERSEGTMA